MLKPLSARFVDEERCGVTAFYRTDAPINVKSCKKNHQKMEKVVKL